MLKTLTIAGSDTSGGAGLQADLKTFEDMGVYGMSALTVMVAQNPNNNWSHDIYPVSLEAIEAQIDTVLGGIGVDALKTGMLPTAEIIALVARKLRQYGAKNIVIDPVMVCKGTDAVVNPGAADALRKELIPLADVATPNVYEAAELSGVRPLATVEAMKEAVKAIHALGAKSVFLKGGAKLGGDRAIDVFYDGSGFEVFDAPLLQTDFTHGAGCTTAAAVAAGLAKGLAPFEAVKQAREFVLAAIKRGFRLNQYVGTLVRQG